MLTKYTAYLSLTSSSLSFIALSSQHIPMHNAIERDGRFRDGRISVRHVIPVIDGPQRERTLRRELGSSERAMECCVGCK
jgi:hypothetical protein